MAYSALLLLAVTIGVAWSQELVSGSQQEDICAITETMATTRPQAQGRPILVRDLYGSIDSDGLSGNTTWRLICPSDYTVLTVVMALETTGGDYLHVKSRELRAACLDTPWALHFMKKSILVGLAAANGSSTFLLRYVCVEKSFVATAEDIFLNANVLRYMKEHDSETRDGTAFNKAAHFLQNPETILSSNSDPILRTILEIADFGLPSFTRLTLPPTHGTPSAPTASTGDPNLEDNDNYVI